MSYIIIEPKTAVEFEFYYELRWRLLRMPWGQAAGTEKDACEDTAYHLLALSQQGSVVGVGRIHFITSQQCQIRYMAVVSESRNQGLGSKILKELENFAKRNAALAIIVNARENAVGFYHRHGYEVQAEGDLLFGQIKHFKMFKLIDV